MSEGYDETRLTDNANVYISSVQKTPLNFIFSITSEIWLGPLEEV